MRQMHIYMVKVGHLPEHARINMFITKFACLRSWIKKKRCCEHSCVCFSKGHEVHVGRLKTEDRSTLELGIDLESK